MHDTHPCPVAMKTVDLGVFFSYLYKFIFHYLALEVQAVRRRMNLK